MRADGTPNADRRYAGVVAAILLALLAGAAPSVAQIDYYVATGGVDGTNTCDNPLAPCASISHAMAAISNVALPGRVIHLAPGAYTEPGLSVDALFHQELSILGSDPDVTIIQAAAAPALSSNRVLWVKVGATATVTGVTFRHGRTPDGVSDAGTGTPGGNGGGILVNGTLRLEDCAVFSNRTGAGGNDGIGGRGGDGGGIYSDGELHLLACKVYGNQTGNGGTGSGGAGGRGGDGGAIKNAGGVLMLQAVSVAHNTNGAGGAGVGGGAGGNGAVWNSGTLVAQNSTLAGNAAGGGGFGSTGTGGEGGGGGAVWNTSVGSAVLSNTTVAGNSAGTGGGGAVSGAAGAGGGLRNDGGTLAVGHTIVGDNSVAPGGVGPDVAGTLTSLGYLLVQYTNGLALAGDFTGVQLDVDPSFGPLDDYGWATLVRVLGFRSPAINAGDPAFQPPPAVDQNGSPRVVGGVIDLGAYEVPNTLLYLSPDGVDGTNECRDPAFRCATLAHAITNAIPEDTIAFASGVYTTVHAVIDRNLVLSSLGDAILEAAGSPAAATSRVLAVEAGVTGRLYNLVIRNGHAPDGSDGIAAMESGGAGQDGGGIFNSGWLLLENCVVASNVAGKGGNGESSGGTGGAGGNGGGLHNDGVLLLSNTVVMANVAGEGGTGGAGAQGGEGGGGGGVYNDGFARIADCVVTGNQAGAGGVSDADGVKGGDGGGVVNNDEIELERVEVSGNVAGAGGDGVSGGTGGAGGGFFNGGAGAATDCTFADNAAGAGGIETSGDPGDGGSGGGIQNEDSLDLVQCTVAANRSGSSQGSGTAGAGGGIWNGGALWIPHGTVASNEAVAPGGSGGGLYAVGGSLVMGMTIVGANRADDAGPDIWGDVESAGYNLVEDATDANLTMDLTGNVIGQPPLLGALEGTARPTRVMPLLGASPALDAGEPGFGGPPVLDERGEPRVEGGRIDIGAYEGFNPDDDGDGMPDDWEILYDLDPYDNGTTNAALGPQGDTDADASGNLDEFIAATRPDQSGSHFRAVRVQRTNAVGVSYFGATGRVYTLWFADTLRTSDWATVAGQVDIAGTGATNALTDTGNATNRFYRLSVKLP